MKEEIGNGEKRLEPVEVDVFDNLINAQAAYLDAVEVAYGHYGMPGGPSEELTRPLFGAMASVAGALLLSVSAGRA